MKPCTIEGCHKPFIAKGMCHMHYRREHRKSTSTGHTCSVEGCGKSAQGLGYCQNHYYRYKRYGNAVFGEPKY